MVIEKQSRTLAPSLERLGKEGENSLLVVRARELMEVDMGRTGNDPERFRFRSRGKECSRLREGCAAIVFARDDENRSPHLSKPLDRFEVRFVNAQSVGELPEQKRGEKLAGGAKAQVDPTRDAFTERGIDRL